MFQLVEVTNSESAIMCHTVSYGIPGASLLKSALGSCRCNCMCWGWPKAQCAQRWEAESLVEEEFGRIARLFLFTRYSYSEEAVLFLPIVEGRKAFPSMRRLPVAVHTAGILPLMETDGEVILR